MNAFSSWVAALVEQMSYAHVFWLMALESSLFPVPSELVMIPAGYLAAKGQLDPVLVTLAGALGSLTGASANYLLGRTVGKTLLLRYGRYLLINADKYHEAERLFLRNANVATFVGRFIPVIRHLISLPAGTFGMALLPFAVLTTVGAGLWCGLLVALGYYLGAPAIQLVTRYSHWAGYAAVAATLLLAGWFLWRRSPRDDGR
jgi:membrane protein DedA with SNARE-associated domain